MWLLLLLWLYQFQSLQLACYRSITPPHVFLWRQCNVTHSTQLRGRLKDMCYKKSCRLPKRSILHCGQCNRLVRCMSVTGNYSVSLQIFFYLKKITTSTSVYTVTQSRSLIICITVFTHTAMRWLMQPYTFATFQE